MINNLLKLCPILKNSKFIKKSDRILEKIYTFIGLMGELGSTKNILIEILNNFYSNEDYTIILEMLANFIDRVTNTGALKN